MAGDFHTAERRETKAGEPFGACNTCGWTCPRGTEEEVAKNIAFHDDMVAVHSKKEDVA